MYSIVKKIPVAILLYCLSLGQTIYAQESYPEKPIKIVVPYIAGAGTDTLARILGDSISKQLKQPVIIENKPGAAGIIASNYLKQQKPDGYTLMLITDGIASVNPSLYKAVSYDPIKDFASITMAISVSNALVVREDSEFKSVRDIVQYAKKNPEKLSYGSAGVGSSLHIAGELLNDTEDIQILHVPYKGGAAEVNALLGGEVSMIYIPLVSALNFQSSGKARIVGIGSKQRNPVIPDVPTFKEDGIDYDSDTWYGFTAPAGVDAKVVTILNDAFTKALLENNDRLKEMGYTVTGGGPEKMDEAIKEGRERWKPLLQKTGLYQKM